MKLISQMWPPWRKTQLPTVKRKFFTPVDTHITPYHQVERVPPENTPEIERNTNIINEYLSKQGDFL